MCATRPVLVGTGENVCGAGRRDREPIAALRPVRLVAIDGPGGAGKSVFAARLARAFAGLQEVTVLHTDDFASWETPAGWWPRLEPYAEAPPAPLVTHFTTTLQGVAERTAERWSVSAALEPYFRQLRGDRLPRDDRAAVHEELRDAAERLTERRPWW